MKCAVCGVSAESFADMASFHAHASWHLKEAHREHVAANKPQLTTKDREEQKRRDAYAKRLLVDRPRWRLAYQRSRERDPDRFRRNDRAWYWRHRDSKLKHVRAYRQSHREECRLRHAVYYADHQGERIAYCRKYHADHRDEILVAQKKYYETHRKQASVARKAYREAHRDQDKRWHEVYREAHREEANEYNRAYYEVHGEEINAHRRAKRRENPDFNRRDRIAREREELVVPLCQSGLTFCEIAERLGLSKTTVWNAYHRIMQQQREDGTAS